MIFAGFVLSSCLVVVFLGGLAIALIVVVVVVDIVVDVVVVVVVEKR